MGMCSLNPLKVARARGEGLAALWGAAEIAGDTGLWIHHEKAAGGSQRPNPFFPGSRGSVLRYSVFMMPL